MMSDLRKAAQAALEALEYMHTEKVDYMIRNKLGDPTKETAARLAVLAMGALRAALAQPEPTVPADWEAWSRSRDAALAQSDQPTEAYEYAVHLATAIRRIVREELVRMNVVKDKSHD